VEQQPTPALSIGSRVILTIFAGRRQFLEILRSYLEVLFDLDLIQEVHLWDFTRDHVDQKYLKLLENSHFKYKLFGFHDSAGLLTEKNRLSRWLSYYEHYSSPSSSHLSNDDILIKCDDDIVYLSLSSFQHYLDIIRSSSSSSSPSASSLSSQCNLFFPNIVNNDVCAYIQTNYSVHNLLPRCDISQERLSYAHPHPLTGISQDAWCDRSEKALKIHHDFLSNPDKYHSMPSAPELIPWSSRISINFFGATGKTIQQSYGLLLAHSRDDERFLTSDILLLLNQKSNCIVPSFVVSHYSFFGQRNDLNQWEMRILLPSYYELMVNRTAPLLPLEDDNEKVSDLPMNLKPRKRRIEDALSFYREIYGTRLLMDDVEDEMELWSDELKLKMYVGFGFQEEDYPVLDSLLKQQTPREANVALTCQQGESED
jgi:hypothetical protein